MSDDSGQQHVIDQRLCIVTLGVESLRRAKRFYLEGLGWRQVDQPSSEIVFIQMPGMVLALYPHHALADDIGVESPESFGGRYGGTTLAYCTHSREETDQVLARAVQAGATLVKPAHDAFWGGYSGYFTDPDGHYWEVAFNPYTQPGTDGTFWM